MIPDPDLIIQYDRPSPYLLAFLFLAGIAAWFYAAIRERRGR